MVQWVCKTHKQMLNSKKIKKKNCNPSFINCREEKDWSNNTSTFALSIESYLKLFYSKVAQLT